MALALELTVNGSADPAVFRYLTWTPYLASLRLLDADAATGPVTGPATGPVTVTLRNADSNVGRLAFRADPTDEGAAEAVVDLPVSGEPVDLLLSGEFMSPSVDDGDAVLEIVHEGTVVAALPFMVRIRKDAEAMTEGERDRFVSAFAALNNHGIGAFRDFYAMHTEETNAEAHGQDAFLPWHRGYLLDLERELQQIDPAVTLPYWRFDRPAPNLFSAEFIGAPSAPGTPARLSPSNPLNTWTIGGVPGIQRNPRFADPRTSPASPQPGRTVLDELTLIGGTRTIDYAYEDFADEEQNQPGFRDYIEGDPHGAAHVSFAGYIRAPGTAAGDPLFFLLHCNVDRLWAQWQWRWGRFDVTEPATYFYRGRVTDPVSTRIGHNLLDTMWPWNGETGGERPATAPRQPFPSSVTVAGPPAVPTVEDLVDYQGQFGAAPTGFDYDDVPFEKA